MEFNAPGTETHLLFMTWTPFLQVIPHAERPKLIYSIYQCNLPSCIFCAFSRSVSMGWI